MDWKSIFLRGIKIGVFLILLTPLVLGPFGISLSNYPKTVFFRSLVEIIFILYLFLIFFNSKYLPKLSILLSSVSVYIGILLLAALTGINFRLSFFGDLHRVEGVILHLHLLILFLILISVFQKEKDWLLFFKTTVIVSAFSSLAGLLQKLGIYSFYALSSNRISGTWTNPDFFAPYVVLAIFLGIFLLLVEKEKNWKIIWLSILILNCFTLIFSGTRAAWIGFGVGLFSLFLFWFFSSLGQNQRKRKLVLFVTLFFSLFLLFIFLNQDRLSLADHYVFQRAVSVFNLNSFFSSSRLPVWQIAVESWKEKPVLGWGPESFSYLFDRHFKASYLQYIPEKIHFDRPHNKILEVMTGAGILGLLSYLCLFIAAFYLLFKRQKKEPIVRFILAAFFICYFVQNLFCFDTIGTYLLFFLVLGFINPRAEQGENCALRIKLPDALKKILKIALICPLIFLVLIAFYQLNLKPTIACRAFVRGVGAEKDVGRALSEYKKGVSQKTIYDGELRKELVARLILILDNFRLASEARLEIIKQLKELRPFLEKQFGKPNKRYLDPYRLVALIAERIYLFEGDSEALLEMEEASRKALDFNSQYPEFYRIIGRARILQGEYSEGEALIRKSRALSSGGVQDKIAFYKNLGLAYLRAGDKPKAAENYKKALDQSFDLAKTTILSQESVQGILIFAESLARVYCQELNDLETCREIYQDAMEIFPVYQRQLQFNLELLME